MKKSLLIITKVICCILNIFKCRLSKVYFKYMLWIHDAQIGKGLIIINNPPVFWKQFGGCGHVVIGDNVKFISYGDQSFNSRCKIMVEKNGKLSIGNNSGFNGVLIYCQSSISIGNNVKIGGGSRIFDTDHHPLDWKVRRLGNKGTKSRPIIIGDDVFVGAGCFILKGVTIGERSIIAAGSVVTKNIPCGEIWGGNPAIFIKKIQNE